jgi:hypothetical protein
LRQSTSLATFLAARALVYLYTLPTQAIDLPLQAQTNSTFGLIAPSPNINMHNLTLEHNKVTPASKTRSSSLSQAFAAFNINSDAQVRNRSHPSLVVSPLPARKCHFGAIAIRDISLIGISS